MDPFTWTYPPSPGTRREHSERSARGATTGMTTRDRSALGRDNAAQDEVHEVRAPRDVRDGAQPHASARWRRLAPRIVADQLGHQQLATELLSGAVVVSCGRTLVTRGHDHRGTRRAQFRSAPSSEHAPPHVSSSPTARVRVARGLCEHGEAHRRACLRGCAFFPPLDGATHPLLGTRCRGRPRDHAGAPVPRDPRRPVATLRGAVAPAHGFSTRNVAKAAGQNNLVFLGML
jgi:hypothetical protein